MSDVICNPHHEDAVILSDVKIRLGDNLILDNVNVRVPLGESTAIV